MDAGKITEKMYAGLLGMCAGIRLGAPVEPGIWTHDRIREVYGEITGYVKEYKHFAADDDSNGPVYFLRALYDDAKDREPTPQDVARAWLNYARDGVGLYWWGGYGIGTEHTAYVNLKNGITAPESGSAAVNGKTLSEQIGGQIFIDTWGLICPGNPENAARLGAAAASVSHDGEGLNGARFFCAAIARAFITSDIGDIIDIGLKCIDAKSLYYKVAEAVREFHKENPEDFRACFAMLERDWGYDKYTGVCHIIPNAGVCVLALLYGAGDFARTIEIAAMCGWDTDCNAGNVGTVLGVAAGLEGIPDRYREPINDCIVLSGVTGSLNILDLPTYAKELAALAVRFCEIKADPPGNEINFDFELQGSTHGFHISDSYNFRMRHSEEKAHTGRGSLEILYDRIVLGKSCEIYWKPFYTREEFSDERYMPVFSPQAYPGQRMSMSVFLEQWEGNDTPMITPYARLAHTNERVTGNAFKPGQGEWSEILWDIPDTQGSVIDRLGIILEGTTSAKFRALGRIFIDDFTVKGKSDWYIDFSKQKINFASVTPFSHNKGAWSLEEGGMHCISPGRAEAYTGRYYAEDVTVAARIKPLYGNSHLIAVRCQGAMRGYWGGLDGDGKATIYKNDFGFKRLGQICLNWNRGEEITLTLSAVGDVITLTANNKEILTVNDGDWKYGMVGCGTAGMGRTLYTAFSVREL